MATNATVAMVNSLLSATLESRAAFSRAARSFQSTSMATELQACADDQDRIARTLQFRASLNGDEPPQVNPSSVSTIAGEDVDERTIVLLAAVLESRRAYRLAMSLAEHLLRVPAPTAVPLALVVDRGDEKEAHFW